RVLDEDADRLGVVEDVLAVLRRAVRVDRRADRADVCEGEVEERPLQARLAEDRERVALADAERQQAVRELVDRRGGLGPRDRPPAALAFPERGGRRRPRAGPAATASCHRRGIVRGCAPSDSGSVSGATCVAMEELYVGGMPLQGQNSPGPD